MLDLLKENHILIKIIDWGMCGLITANHQKLDLICGTPKFMAPEILRGQPYSSKVDIFSVGVILY